jgi:hypothetical protein
LANTLGTGPARIEEFLPIHDVSARYEKRINAPPSVVYQAVLNADFRDVWLVQLLMTLRTGKRAPPKPMPADFCQRLQGTGFVLLAEVPDEELILGVVGRFWRPDGGRYLQLTAEAFPAFCRPGYAKAAWNFHLRSVSPEATILATETRVQCFGRNARWKFRLYWTLVGPFSGLMRWAMLKQVKKKAEASL